MIFALRYFGADCSNASWFLPPSTPLSDDGGDEDAVSDKLKPKGCIRHLMPHDSLKTSLLIAKKWTLSSTQISVTDEKSVGYAAVLDAMQRDETTRPTERPTLPETIRD